MAPTPSKVIPIARYAAEYAMLGWRLCPIQPGSKGPVSRGWNVLENALPAAELLPAGWGVGLLHAYSGTCAIDIDDIDLARAWLLERGVSLDELLAAPDAVLIDSGRVGHSKLLYRLFIPLPSKKVIHNKSTNIIDFRCGTANGLSVQDVLPATIHPATRQPYTWGGKGDWHQLPELPQALVTIWHDLLAPRNKRSVPIPGTLSASMTELAAALQAVSPDCDRTTWVQCGMALQAAGDAADELEMAFEVWHSWSAKSEKKYPGFAEVCIQWNSFKPKEDGIGPGTLFHHAFKAGWVRPPPDVSQMFEAVPARSYAEANHTAVPTCGLPRLDLSVWPDELIIPALEVAHEVGCDVTVPLVASLCAVSGAADKRSGLRITDTWRVPPTLWAMTLGEPSDKKSPGSKPMFAPLHKLEADDRDRYDAEMLLWKGLEARYAAEYKAYREWMTTPDSQLPNAAPPPLSTLPPEPVRRRLLLQDSTTQKVVNLAAPRPNGMLLWLDEMNNWFRKLNDPRSTDDRGCWVQGYETGPYQMDRMGTGTISCENLALSIYGNCQPEVFRQHVEHASHDGVIQRFLPVTLDPNANAVWELSVPAFMSAKPAYEQLLRRTFAAPHFEYLLLPDAEKEFHQFCAWLTRFRANERVLEHSTIYQTSLGKLEGHTARLVLLWHLIRDPHAPFVSRETVVSGCRLLRHYFLPMLQHAFLNVAQQRDKVGQAIFEFVLRAASSKPTVSLPELRQVIRSNSKDTREHDNLIRVTMEDMSVLGYVWMYQDHPRSPIWAINPALAQQFKVEREQLIRARQLRVEMTREIVRQKNGTEATVSNALGWDTL
jgi:hypothetical protein